MSQSSILETKVSAITALLDTVKDNAQITKELNARIASLNRTIGVIKPREEYEIKLADTKSKTSARVATIAADLGADTLTPLSNMADNCETADCKVCNLCKYDYLKGKGLSRDDIRLVMGL